jgi:hypothetical protein
VAMLIMPLIKNAMDMIVKVRSEQNISPGNKFFFASNSEDGHLQQYKILARVANEANLEQPELVRSTKLRKYLATMAQVKFFSHCLLLVQRPVFC